MKNHQHFHSLKHLRKIRRVKGIFPGAMPEKFSSCEAPGNGCFSLIKYFHPSLLREKSLTFSFSEASEKIRRVKGFSVASSRLAIAQSIFFHYQIFPSISPP